MEELKRTLFVLASEYSVQESLFPNFTCIGDEMVLEFEEVIESYEKSSLPPKGIESLELLDEYLISHSGEKYQEHYLDNDLLKTSEIWANIRILALSAISDLGWVYEKPKSNQRAVYVSEHKT